MKLVSCSAVMLLAAAGTAFAAKNTEYVAVSPAPGFTAPVGSPSTRAGFLNDFNVAGIASWNAAGSGLNTVINYNIGAGNAINGVGWDVTVTAFSPSWRSELAVLVTDSTGTGGFFFRPGTNSSSGGPTQYISDFSGNGTGDGPEVIKLADASLPDVVALGDGIIRLEFFETYDDGAGFQDGVWNSGRIVFQTLREVPAPGAAGLLGLAGVGLLGRKRR